MADHPLPLPARKSDHLRIAAGAGVEGATATGLDAVRLRHRALPGRDLDAVDLTTVLLGRRLAAPLVISAMTGGTPEAEAINRDLARAAAAHEVGLVLGSARALLREPALLSTYRAGPRPPLLLANLGAAGLDRESALRAVDVLAADGLSVHLNPLQEAVQPEGEPHFAGAAERFADVVDALRPIPVVVKEVGFGMDAADVRLLADAGVAAVDVAGAGGTNWALVEGRRDPEAARVAAAFAGWGVPTRDALEDALAAAPGLPVVASGGIRDGVDVARCLALGATAAGIARPLLLAARAGRVTEAVGTVVRQLRIATWLAGSPASSALGRDDLR